MEHEFRVIVEKVSVTSQKVVKRDTLKIYDIKKPDSILDLGLRHQEQISLLEKVQNALLAEQTLLIELDYDFCPKCGEKLVKNGFMNSKFHAVFSDHKLRMQKHRCKSPDCNWQSTPTSTSVFGTDTHPDLAKLQCEQGALYSYREAQDNLESLNCQRRSVNNHVQLQHITKQVGERLSQDNLAPPSQEELPEAADELIIQVDGGHIPTKDKDRRSFEALAGIAYRPSSIEQVDRHHRQITDKSCVVSAMDDKLQSIKTYLYHAALKQGLSPETHVTALADGADNCWAALSVLEPHCRVLEPLLDWFHVAKKFQNVRSAVEEEDKDILEGAKWKVWHGKYEEALSKLELLVGNITDPKKRKKLEELYSYLEGNKDYLVNYEEREKTNKTYTSQVAESHIDTLINVRHKKKRKMQWTREGAHNVLQIRALMASNEWEDKWLDLVLPNEEQAA